MYAIRSYYDVLYGTAAAAPEVWAERRHALVGGLDDIDDRRLTIAPTPASQRQQRPLAGQHARHEYTFAGDIRYPMTVMRETNDSGLHFDIV